MGLRLGRWRRVQGCRRASSTGAPRCGYSYKASATVRDESVEESEIERMEEEDVWSNQTILWQMGQCDFGRWSERI